MLVPLEAVDIHRRKHRVELETTVAEFQQAVPWRADGAVDYEKAYQYWADRLGFAPREIRPHELAGALGGEAVLDDEVSPGDAMGESEGRFGSDSIRSTEPR